MKTYNEIVQYFFFLDIQPLTGKELSIILVFANKCAFHVFEGKVDGKRENDVLERNCAAGSKNRFVNIRALNYRVP